MDLLSIWQLRTKPHVNVFPAFYSVMELSGIPFIFHLPLIPSIDLLMPTTNIIVANTPTDVQEIHKRIAEMESEYSHSPGKGDLSSPNQTNPSNFSNLSNQSNQHNQFNSFNQPHSAINPSTQSNNRVDFSLVPIVTCQWVLDCHTEYTVRDFDDYLWRNGVFSNLTFFIYGFQHHVHSVRQCIEENDGTVTDDMETATYIVCPRTVTSDIYQDERAVSDKWLRRCRDEKRLVSRSGFALFRPYPSLLHDKSICLTGFGNDKKVMGMYIR